ncbi:hypothetical protein AB1N83_004652 [Pleurotus pulmonarius]
MNAVLIRSFECPSLLKPLCGKYALVSLILGKGLAPSHDEHSHNPDDGAVVIDVNRSIGAARAHNNEQGCSHCNEQWHSEDNGELLMRSPTPVVLNGRCVRHDDDLIARPPVLDVQAL